MTQAIAATAIGDFDRLPVPAAVIELDGTISAVNEAGTRLMARPARQIVGKKVWDFAPGLDHMFEDLVGMVRARGELCDEITVATPEGPRTLQYIVALRDVGSRMVLPLFAMDISAQKAIAGAVVDADAPPRLDALGLVAGGIAHDFNNQLVSVLAEASAAREDPELGDSAREALRRIEAAANRMAQLTRQLLAYAGRGRFITEVIDPDELVRQTHEQLTRTVRPDARLTVATGAAGAAVEVDRALLREVIINLVANASEALRDGGGEIGVTTALVEGVEHPGWLLEVSDNGVGMDQPTVARMFDPFFSTKPGRHGLGLSAAHGIVRRLGGDIEVDTAPGRGTRMRVRLPLVPGAAPRRHRSSSHPPVPSVQGMRVLVADDEPSVRTTVQRLFARRGATVVTAADGTEAARALADGRYGLIVLDVMMPGRTGHELVPLARQLQPGVPVLLMSGYTDSSRGVGGGDEPDLFLEKPFTAKILDAAIADLLRT